MSSWSDGTAVSRSPPLYSGKPCSCGPWQCSSSPACLASARCGPAPDGLRYVRRRDCPGRFLAMRLRIHLSRASPAHLSGLRIVSENDPLFSVRRHGEGAGSEVMHATHASRQETTTETCSRAL